MRTPRFPSFVAGRLGLGVGVAALCAASGQAWSADAANNPQNATLVTLQLMYPGVTFATQNNTGGGTGPIAAVGGAPMNDAASASEAADQWVRQFVSALGVGDLAIGSDLEKNWQSPLGNGKHSVVAYTQFIDGLPVEASALRLTVLTRPAPAGHAWSQTHHVVLAGASLAKRPEAGFAPLSITGAQAITRVQQVARFATLPQWSEPELVVFAGLNGEIAGTTVAVRAWKVRGSDMTDPAQPRAFTFFVDAASNEIAHVRNDILHADITGSVTGLATPGNIAPSATNPAALTTINQIRVDVVNADPPTFAYTDRTGNFTIPWTGTDPVSLRISTEFGRWSRVQSVAGPLINLTTPGVVPGTPVTININPTDVPAHNSTGLAQVNALNHTNITHDFIKDRQPSLTTIDTNILTNVQLGSTCNAFFSPGELSINFFAAGGGCANTSFNTVVNHEYGHFLVNRRPPVTTLQQGTFGEGFSDTISILINDDPIIGEGFFENQSPSWVRNPATAGRVFPCQGGFHDCGQVLGGFVWDVRNLIVARDGTQTGLSTLRQLHTDYYMITTGNDTEGNAFHPLSAIEYLTADDDDGQLGNGTPNYGLIRAAAIGRGVPSGTLPCVDDRAGLSVLTGVPSFTTSNTPLTYSLRVQNGSQTIDPASVRLEYRLNATGNYISVPATLVSGNDYQVTMPGIACANSVQFRFAVNTTQGQTVITPIDSTCGPSTYTTSAFDSFVDTLQTFENGAQGWSEGPIDGVFWTFGGRFRLIAPTGQAGTPPGDTTPEPGTNAWTTFSSNSQGSNSITGGGTALTSPVFDLSAVDDATFTYNRWWSSNHTGTGTLRDYFRVQVSTNNGASWTTVEDFGPNNGGGAWQPGSFSLSAVGLSPTSTVRVRFLAANLGAGNVAAAAIDDVRIRGTVCNDTRTCDSIDFNNDNSTFDPQDIAAFLSVYSEGACIPAGATCNDIDFNNDTSIFDPQDIASFLSVYSEGPCL